MKLKRLISAVSAGVMLLSAAAVPVYAEGKNTETKEGLELPFELTAPTSVHASLTEAEIGNTVNLCWSKNKSMSEWAARTGDPETFEEAADEAFERGFTYMRVYPQLDWSIGDTEHWQWSEETDDLWLNDGYDSDGEQRLGDWAYTSLLEGPDMMNTAWVFRWFGYIYSADDPEYKDPLWYGTETYKGWKDVIEEDQYRVVTDDEGSKYAVIDFAGHPVYVRMRYVVGYRYEDEGNEEVISAITSEWSKPTAVTTSFAPMTKEELTAPDISGLRMCEDEEFNGFPVFAMNLNVPEKLADAITRVASDFEKGGNTLIAVFARVRGQEDWVVLQGYYWINTGEMKFSLQNLYENQEVPLNMPIEVRARYVTYQSDEYGVVYSDWSETLEFIKIIPGDVNGDGLVTMKDLTTLQRYVNGWKITIVEEAADLNGDGSISMRDLTALQKLINSK